MATNLSLSGNDRAHYTNSSHMRTLCFCRSCACSLCVNRPILIFEPCFYAGGAHDENSRMLVAHQIFNRSGFLQNGRLSGQGNLLLARSPLSRGYQELRVIVRRGRDIRPRFDDEKSTSLYNTPNGIKRTSICEANLCDILGFRCCDFNE